MGEFNKHLNNFLIGIWDEIIFPLCESLVILLQFAIDKLDEMW